MIPHNPRLFIDIATRRSLSQAAAEHSVSQSAASQFVHELERKLGIMLLDRSTRPLTVTPAGHLYAEFCRDLVERERQFLEAVTRRAGGAGELRVGSIYSIGLSEMARLKQAFAAAHEQAKLTVEFLHPANVYEGVRAGRLDLGLVSYPEADKEIAVVEWRDEEMLVVAQPDHLLAQSGVALAGDLRGHDFVAFDTALPIRRAIDRFFAEHDVRLNVVAEFDNIQVVKEAVTVGTGISVLPEGTFAVELRAGRIAGIPLFEKGLVRPLGIIHRKRRKLPALAASFIDLVRSPAY